MGNFLNFCLYKFSLKYNISQRISNYISERRNYEAGLVHVGNILCYPWAALFSASRVSFTTVCYPHLLMHS